MIKEKLRKVRMDKGISQKEIASVLPTDVSNYNRKESGDVKITRREWEKLASFLEVPMEDIFQEDMNNRMAIKYKKPIFNDSSIGFQYVEMMPSVVENLQELISHLKIEIESLTEKNKSLLEEIQYLKQEK